KSRLQSMEPTHPDRLVENVTAPSAGGFPGPEREVRLRMRLPLRTTSSCRSFTEIGLQLLQSKSWPRNSEKFRSKSRISSIRPAFFILPLKSRSSSIMSSPSFLDIAVNH